MSRDHFVEVDALVMGGGITGCFAALELAGRGRSVLVVDKSPVRRSGNAACGIDHWGVASPELGELTDDPELFHRFAREALENALSGNQDVFDVSLFGTDLGQEELAVIALLEDMGIQVRDRHGKLRLVPYSGGTAIWIEGGDIKPKLADRLRADGVRTAEHVMLTDLLTDDDGRVVGAVGFHIRTGAFHVIAARSVLVATGLATRVNHPFLDTSDADRVFDTAYHPFDTGDGQMAAYRAGASLTNMEFLALTVTPRDHGSLGVLSGFLSAGCRMVNGLGENFMARYIPVREEAGPRQRMVHAVWSEIEAGRGPVSFDTTTLSPGDLEDLRTGWGNELPMLPRYLEAKGLVLGRDLVEIVPTVALGRGEIVGGATGATEVPGLFTGGDCAANLLPFASGAAITGRRAARAMDVYLAELDESGGAAPVPRPHQVEALRADVFDPLHRRGGPDRGRRAGGRLSWQDAAAELRQISDAYLGIRRNAEGISAARDQLDRLWDQQGRLAAADSHELMRLHETRNGIRYARLMAMAAEERRESRFGNGAWQLRSDHPETRDEEWSMIYLRPGASVDEPELTRHHPSIGLDLIRAVLASMTPSEPSSVPVAAGGEGR